MVQDKQDGLKSNETAGMNLFTGFGRSQGEAGNAGKPEKARKALWCKHNIFRA